MPYSIILAWPAGAKCEPTFDSKLQFPESVIERRDRRRQVVRGNVEGYSNVRELLVRCLYALQRIGVFSGHNSPSSQTLEIAYCCPPNFRLDRQSADISHRQSDSNTGSGLRNRNLSSGFYDLETEDGPVNPICGVRGGERN